MRVVVLFAAILLSSCPAQISVLESKGGETEMNANLQKIDAAFGVLAKRIEALEEAKKK